MIIGINDPNHLIAAHQTGPYTSTSQVSMQLSGKNSDGLTGKSGARALAQAMSVQVKRLGLRWDRVLGVVLETNFHDARVVSAKRLISAALVVDSDARAVDYVGALFRVVEVHFENDVWGVVWAAEDSSDAFWVDEAACSHCPCCDYLAALGETFGFRFRSVQFLIDFKILFKIFMKFQI